MGIMKRRRNWQILKYGWKDSGEIYCEPRFIFSRITILLDIIKFYRKYYLFSNQYKDNMLWEKTKCEKIVIAERLGKANTERDEWIDDYYANRKFLLKYSTLKYETSPRLMEKRLKLYQKRYNMGIGCVLQNDVIISREHNLNGTISIGNNVLLSKHCFIDYSGDVVIGNDVKISNGVVIESHSHIIDKKAGNTIVPSSLFIEEGVSLLSRAFVADTCHRIGRHARIGADCCIRSNIPPYALVAGNPAKIIGFIMSPEEILEFEKINYAEPDRIPIDVLEKNYDKYYRNRWKTTKEWIRL